jgi:hypothetical protein
VVFAHHLTGKVNRTSKSVKGVGSSVAVECTSIEEGSSTILPAFERFLGNVLQGIQDRLDKEENNLV